MTEQPLVSAILPAYNPNREYLNEAVNSVLSQTYERVELVIVDDGSDTPVEERLSDEILEDEKVTLERQENQGYAAATNSTIDLSNGRFIAWIAQDDVWEKEKISKQVERTQQTGADMVFTNAACIGPEGEKTGEITGQFPDGDLFDPLLIECYPVHETILMDKESMGEDVKLDPAYEVTADLELYLRTFDDYKISHIDEVLAKTRSHGSNLASNVETAFEEREKLRRSYLENRDEEFRQRCLNNLYRQKGKSFLLIDQDSSKGRKALKKAFKHNYLDYKSQVLLLSSVAPKLSIKLVRLYRKSRSFLSSEKF